MRRLCSLSFAVLAICTVSTRASAHDGWTIDEHRPATWDDDAEQLADAGLGQSRGPALRPHDDVVNAPAAQRDPDVPAVLFLNFDGAELVSGPDDARSNVTTISGMAGAYPPYGSGGAKRDAVLQAVREDWSAYNAVITDRRPEGGDYIMAMVGPGNPDGDSKLGLALLDCGDRRTRNNIVFAFHRASDSHTATSTATTISQEIGHSLGLEHVSEPSDIMNPTNVGGDPSFRDDCLPITDLEPSCPDQHERSCGSPNQQNAHLELYDVIGPATPDASGPSIQLLSPLDGENYDLDETFEVVFEADDGIAIRQAALFVNTVLQSTDDAAPFGWTVRQSVAGEYALRVEVQDSQGFIRVSNTVNITVGRASPIGGHGALPPSSRAPANEPQGCACRSGNESDHLRGLWLFGLVALGLRRRAK